MLLRKFFYILLLLLTSCLYVNDSDIAEQYITMTLSYKDTVETLRIDDNLFSPADGATYFNTNTFKYTSIRLHNRTENEPSFLSISFSGNTTGNYDWLIRHNYIIIQKHKDEMPPIFLPINGQTDVSIYGDIGDRVEGSFYGVVHKAFTKDTIRITGEFSVQRVNDRNSDL